MPSQGSWHYVWRLVRDCLKLAAGRLPTPAAQAKELKLTSGPDSQIAGYLAEPLAANPGNSALLPLFDGVDAMVARLTLIQAAQTSIDLQYYLFRNDDIGRLILWQLLEAAKRGVRVRLLLDDTASIKMDRQLASLALHPNISVRLYNPSARRILRSLSFLGDFGRLNHRMHNKSLTVDNRLSVVGGRNIGNEYFSNDETLEFGDLDALLAGPVVDEISDQFDEYWNSPLAYPVERINPLAEPRAGLDYIVSLVNSQKAQLGSHPYIRRLAKSPLLRHLADNRVNWFFGEAWLLADPAHKRLASPDKWMVKPLLAEFSRVKDELVIISPYFVPTNQGLHLLTELVSRGVEVTVITNSLAATDVLAVHSGYQKYRQRLLGVGVKIYEVKEQGRRRHTFRARSRASLHAKSFLFDQARFFIGSFNFDPRSATLNTEMGVLIEQLPMADCLRAWLVPFLLHDTYELRVVNGQLCWHESNNGSVFYREPGAGLMRRMLVNVLAWLPLESQL